MAERATYNMYVLERVTWYESSWGEHHEDHAILAVTMGIGKAKSIAQEDAVYPYDFKWINNSYIGYTDEEYRAHGVRYTIHNVPSY